MTKTFAGALLGTILAFAGLAYGFGGFVLVALLMALGAAAGHFMQTSDFSISDLFDALRKSTSSR